MKPLKLILTAFGPYKNNEVIDFSELQNNRLFVVSGNTGAGKTTIFDGICFALYGAASGEDRNDAKLLRSHFAEDDVHTSVELEFELHGRIYRILRQLAHTKQGNKGATGERYEFFEKKENQEVPAVDRQMVSEINKKIEDLVGLSQAQFRQIVMLPQGEFRKLLTSQTEDKEEILRRIFKTEPYKWISERLKNKKRLAEESYKREQETLENHFTTIRTALPNRDESTLGNVLSQEQHNIHQIMEGLNEEAVYYEEEVHRNNIEYAKAYKVHDKKQSEYHQAKVLNERFYELDDKKKTLAANLERIPLYKEKEKLLELAEQASKLELYENQVNEWLEDEKAKKQSLEEAITELGKAEVQVTQTEASYKREEGKKSERDGLQSLILRLEEWLPTVKELDVKKEKLTQAKLTVENLTDRVKTTELNIKRQKESKDQLSMESRVIEKEVDYLADKRETLSNLRIKYQLVNDYLRLQGSQAKLQEDARVIEKTYKLVKEQYTLKEKAWFEGQASILASHLYDGMPCPVCGSDDHPNLATGNLTPPTKEELEVLKKDLDEKDTLYRNVSADLRSTIVQLQCKGDELQEQGIPLHDVQSSFDLLVEEGKNLKLEVDSLTKKREQLITYKETIDQQEKTLNQLEKEKVDVDQKYQLNKSAYESDKAVIEEQIRSIPEQVRVLNELEKQIREKKQFKLQLDTAWENAQKQLHTAKEAQAKTSTAVSHIERQSKETTAKRERAEHQFKAELLKANFSNEAEYHQAKLIETDRQQLKQEITKFNQTLSTLKQQVKEVEEGLTGKIRVELQSLEDQLEECKQKVENSLLVLNKNKGYQEELRKLQERILATHKKAVALEQQYNHIADLYDVIRGQNSLKISFERYLQIEYLEQIIQVANIRLKHQSNGQYQLIRSDRQESRGKQSGLGLDVYDAYTGQARDVKTLSGGEKFNASLCLALGMADVIQSFQGGVSIDTMFIDEGFGSLDEESLNKSIDTLIDLQQSGRMIGVISHVQELKAAIPAILEVKKTREGYSQTRFVIR
jgi:exonuclease SbcC